MRDHLAEIALAVSLGIICIIVAVLLLIPVVHHVGDTKYCTGSGVGIGSNGGTSVVVMSVPCGTWQAGEPGVQP